MAYLCVVFLRRSEVLPHVLLANLPISDDEAVCNITVYFQLISRMTHDGGAAMTEMHRIGGSTLPLVVCDKCRHEIENYDEARVLWDAHTMPAPCYHVHTGRCQQVMTQAIRSYGGRERFESLDVHLRGVLVNMRKMSQHPPPLTR